MQKTPDRTHLAGLEMARVLIATSAPEDLAQRLDEAIARAREAGPGEGDGIFELERIARQLEAGGAIDPPPMFSGRLDAPLRQGTSIALMLIHRRLAKLREPTSGG
ncbi:hypothetical protein TUM18999_29170 [Pseudomonas tohonis]|uniref:Uncharacterized protein n=1 Tax=Pseudomonas tohonis TaxID=2725477 RepID=A0A6J4E651_9PSED|nr:hypothetical protein [Pseudomonas tohonis]BCG24726.1 hypothetical protein TUM18999_29170 [Pseudomonas tohonis]GJN54035.1 hypothetical protein TUM20286_37870 [Pseudomonas tohonis]